jgi:hypothetical protein
MTRFDNGWVKVYRRISITDVGKNGHCLAVMTTLLMWASRFPSTVRWKGKPRNAPAGSVLLGIRELADQLQFSKDTVYRQLKYLAARDTISLESSTQGTLVTVRNWAEYQDSDENLRRDEGHGSDTVKDIARTLAEHKPTLNGELKNKRTKNRFSCPFDLEAAYQRYPRKEGKTPGLKRLGKEIQNDEDYRLLLTSIESYSSKVLGEDPKFIKTFSTFVGQWRDYAESCEVV